MASPPAMRPKIDRKREGLRVTPDVPPPAPEPQSPETYELSLTDLVENNGTGAGGAVRINEKRTASLDREMGRRLSGDKERMKSRSRQRGGSIGDGVMLNMYMPAAARRSFNFRRSGEGSAKIGRNGSQRYRVED